jgi:hypothetical protein
MSTLLKRLGIAVAVFVISGAAVLVATFFLFAAFYFWFEEFLRPPLAALATAGSLLGFALIVIVLGFAVSASLKRKPRKRFDWLLELLEAPDGMSAAAIGTTIGRRLQSFARKNTQTTIIASLLAGLAIGISPGLRALLRDILKED